jgi:hypothetical protein
VIEGFHLTPTNRPFLISKIERLDPHKLWVVDVREKKAKRSNQQNSRYWLFLQGFGQYLGYTKDEMHDLCRYKFLAERVMVGDQEMVKLKSTPKTTTKEFAEYCDLCIMWAAQLGYVWDEWQV